MTDAVGVTHHVSVGGELLLIRPGTYRKRAAPIFGARFTSGDPSYNNLSFWQHWVQSCWVGGMDAPDWKDDAMFDQAVGVDSSNHEFIALARDLTKGAGDWTLNADSANCVRIFCVYKGVLYCLMGTTTPDSYLYSYSPGADAWSLFKTFTAENVRSIHVFAEQLVVGGSADSLHRFDGTTWTDIAFPGGQTQTVYTMRSFRDRLYVGFGRFIWRLKSDWTWDGSVVFFEASGVDDFVAAETHLGYLYLLSANGHLLRTDGNNTFDIWSWDGNTVGASLRSYDGRLFVGTYEYSDVPDTGQGVLYQFSGSAVTQLKRWGKVGRATTVGNLIVYDRKMFYGASSLLGLAEGFGVAVYDAVEDSHSIFASSRDTVNYEDTSLVGRDWIVDDLYVFEGYLFISVRKHGLFRTPLRFRDIALEEATFDRTANGAGADPPNGGWLTSSEYDGGTPGTEKLWRQILVHCELPDEGCTVNIDYSVDGGSTWVLAGTVTKTGLSTRYDTVLALNNVKSARLKYRLTLRSTASEKTPKVRGVVVSYVPRPSPNWLWDFSVVMSDRQQLLDGSTADVDADEVIRTLEGQYRTGSLIPFIDADGTVYAGVLVYDFQKDVGIQTDNPQEAVLRITLLEANEVYS